MSRENGTIKTKAGASLYLTGIGKVKSRLTLKGIKSTSKAVGGSTTRLIIKAADNKTDPNSFISVFKFEVKGKERRYQLAETGTLSKTESNNLSSVEYKAKKYGESSYYIVLEDLTAGEYGIVIGDPNPDIYGNIYTSLSWKGLKLDVNFKYSLGNDVYNYQRSQLESMNNNWNQTTAVINRWRYEGQVTNMPRVMDQSSEQWVNNERFSDRWIEDGSYLKLKNVRLTYKVPVNLSWLLGLSVWGECNNVFTISKYTGNDPEFSAGNGVLYQGIDAGYLNLGRNFSLGVTINL